MFSRFSITILPKLMIDENHVKEPWTQNVMNQDRIPDIETGDSIIVPTTVTGWLEWIKFIIDVMVKDYTSHRPVGQASYVFTPRGKSFNVTVVNPWHSLYISKLTDDVFEDILSELNDNVPSQLFNTLVNECGIDRRYLLKEAFANTRCGKFVSNDNVPTWLLLILHDTVDDLLGNTLESKFAVTHSMTIVWVKQTLERVWGIEWAPVSGNVSVLSQITELKSD